jgi:hypothetical protein
MAAVLTRANATPKVAVKVAQMYERIDRHDSILQSAPGPCRGNPLTQPSWNGARTALAVGLVTVPRNDYIATTGEPRLRQIFQHTQGEQ